MSAEQLQDWAPRVEAALRRLPARFERTLRELAPSVERDARSRARVLTGEYRDSLTATASGDELVLSSTHPQAALIERGGVAHGTPFLAVPLHASARSSRTPRRDGPLFRVRLRDGRLFLASRRGARSLDLRWRLVESVVVRPTGVLGAATLAAGARLVDELETATRAELGVG